MGFRGAVGRWFDSYLSNRKMFVDICGVKSNMKTIDIGLPQGAVSSPYLVLSLCEVTMHRSSDKLNFIHFADIFKENHCIYVR